MKKIVPFLLLILIIIIVSLVIWVLCLEHELLDKTRRFEKPTLHYTDVNLVQDYLHHSRMFREGKKLMDKDGDPITNKDGDPMCIRPFYKYDNASTRNEEEYGKEPCRTLSAEHILSLTIKKQETLGIYNTSREKLKPNFKGQLKFSNGESIAEQHAIYIKNSENESILNVNFQYTTLNSNLPCGVNIYSKEHNCHGSFSQIDIFKNQEKEKNKNQKQEKIATLIIDPKNKTVAFQSLMASSWEDGRGHDIKSTNLCDIHSQKELIYKHTVPAIKIGCYSSSMLNTESQRLASLFAEHSEIDFNSTLDKDLTIKTDEITQKHCVDANCQTKILVMNSTTGEILAMSSHKDQSRKSQNELNQQEIVIDNFRREPAGSVVKPIFAQAVLTQNLDLKDLVINRVEKGIFKEQENRTGRLLGHEDKSLRFININSEYAGDYDFNKFIAKSNNVYASSLFFLANFHPQKSNINNEASFPFTGFKKIPNGVILPNSAQKYAEHLSYYPLLSPKEQHSSPAQREYALDDDVPQWLRVLNGYGIKFTHKQATKFGYVRDYLWGDLHFSEENLNPEREAFNDTECITQGYFACKMYAWTLGEGDSRFSTIALAEMFSSIATDQYVQGSLATQKDKNFATASITQANIPVRQGMEEVIKTGTAKVLAPYGGDDGVFFIMGKTGTPSVINKSLATQVKDNLKRKQLFVVAEAVAPYQYQELLGNQELKQRVIKKLHLHPYFLNEKEADIATLLHQFLNGEIQTPSDNEPDTEDEKRLALIIAPKGQTSSQPIIKGCTVVISAYQPSKEKNQPSKEKYHIKIAKELLETFKDNHFLDKCS